ncbi:BTAD domain-containing putative transcriptional regulator [Frankia sp. Mgl5]|uniref:BTAD domain-containing putative transcriptional regulator n=1 Tax=Frankia sp. Mgl5 TaxID=2933793 RepID=UPI002551FC39|nr:BTAD domain-containing putative transcriptional regulator [Frankia sp. Mgl5]
MVAQYESAGQAEALAAYHSARRHLTDELGVDPGARLRALYAAILAGADCPVPSPVRPRPLPAAIGADRNPLAGREADLRWLERACERVLDSDSGDVVIVEGEAGMGVSRLVAEFAHPDPAASSAWP